MHSDQAAYNLADGEELHKMKDLPRQKGEQEKGSYTRQKSRLVFAGLLSCKQWQGSVRKIT